MEPIYGNIDDTNLSKTSSNEGWRVSSGRGNYNSGDHTVWKRVLVALSLLLLCALGGLCVLGALYWNKRVAFEALSEDYSRAQEQLSVQQNSLNETERKYEELKVEHCRVQECVSQCSETEMRYEELRIKLRRAQGRVSQCNGKRTCSLCEERWMFFGFKCYYFSTDKLNWTMSRDYCTGKGGHLVTVTSKEEQDFVSSHAQVTRWIGLNDLETEGQWMWVNNKSLSETGVTFWFERESGSDEPDNWQVMDFSGENCGSLGDGNGFIDTWFDASCQNLKEYICEK